MRVLAVTTWGTACGIADYARQLADGLRVAAPGVELIPSVEALDPAHDEIRSLIHDGPDVSGIDVVWLNHHDALHSRWTAAHVQALQDSGIAVVVTYHDTVDGERQPNSAKAHALAAIADGFIVHESTGDLDTPTVHYLRQGVAPPELPRAVEHVWASRRHADPHLQHIQAPAQVPVLGTVGFNFPWKNYDRLASVTADCGWALAICCNNATPAEVERWRNLNPWTSVFVGFRSAGEIVSLLSGCDATIFAYECANTGTSGAIRLGLAARKPVIAWRGCRQFRDLLDDLLGHTAIHWTYGFTALPQVLAQLPIQRVDPGIVQLAERDSWARQATHYAAIFAEAMNRRDR